MSLLIQLSGVHKHYPDGDVWALSNIDLSIQAGEFVSISGPSGCGKSTLLNMIGAIDRPTSGTVHFQGMLIDDSCDLDRLRSSKIGFVFQSFHLLPNLTAAENVQIPMFPTNRAAPDRERRACDLLALVGLQDRTTHLPGQLSNGQRQRVAIARALANEPSLVLADEPTGALDSTAGDLIIDLLRTICQDTGLTLAIVTHDAKIADAADRKIVMKDGRILSQPQPRG